MRGFIGRYFLMGALLLAGGALPAEAAPPVSPQFAVKLPGDPKAGTITGRLYVYVGKTNAPEPREQGAWWNSAQAFGIAIDAMKPGDTAIVAGNAVGAPYARLADLPKGQYYVQATLDRYVRYPRADGHTIWASDSWLWKSGLLYSTPPASIGIPRPAKPSRWN